MSRFAFYAVMIFAAGMGGILVSLTSGIEAQAQNHCLRVDHEAGYTKLNNFCSQLISVHWRDQGYCSTGCQENIAPNAWNSATLWRGSTTYCVCYGYDYCC